MTIYDIAWWLNEIAQPIAVLSGVAFFVWSRWNNRRG